jgi:hypothetical protein
LVAQVLAKPEIRLHTSAGNAVQVTAERGRLEAPRKPGGGLDLKRGELAGGNTPARRIDINVHVGIGILGLQKQKLSNKKISYCIINLCS